MVGDLIFNTFITSCAVNNSANVTPVEVPSVGIIGEPIIIAVTFQARNGCGKFGKFIESGNEMTRTVEVEAKYEGCICPYNVPLIETSYKFTPNYSGEYIFRFKSGVDEFITITVLVAEE